MGVWLCWLKKETIWVELKRMIVSYLVQDMEKRVSWSSAHGKMVKSPNPRGARWSDRCARTNTKIKMTPECYFLSLLGLAGVFLLERPLAMHPLFFAILLMFVIVLYLAL